MEPAKLAAIAVRGLATLNAFEVHGDVLVWRGTRPGPGWHAHGWTECRRRMLIDGALRWRTLRKRRWARADRSATTHSRPPEDLGLVHEALVVALELWCWLDGALGLHRYVTPYVDGPSRRTVQRWLGRALPRAVAFQSAIRRALIERSEPRPWETLFPAGLSPPGGLLRRRWRDPSTVASLRRGLAFLFVGASQLSVSPTSLLAEARRGADGRAGSLV